MSEEEDKKTDSRPLEVFATGDLLDELHLRTGMMLFIGISLAVGAAEQETTWKLQWKGDEYQLIGLLEEAKHQLLKRRRKGG